MADESVLVTFRMPKKLGDELDAAVREYGYASRTELLREALRAQLLKNIESMRGALKGKVKFKGTVSQLMRKEWKKALKEAKGDAKKASEIMDRKEKGGLGGLRL